jgi:hypothetical protein
MPTSRGTATNSVSGKVDKNDGSTVSSSGTTDTGTTSSAHSHTFSVWSGGINANHTHSVVINGVTINHQHAFSTTSGPISASHTHSIPSHGHTLSGTIGTVTGGVDGNNSMTSGTQTLPHVIVNYIIKT